MFVQTRLTFSLGSATTFSVVLIDEIYYDSYGGNYFFSGGIEIVIFAKYWNLFDKRLQSY